MLLLTVELVLWQVVLVFEILNKPWLGHGTASLLLVAEFVVLLFEQRGTALLSLPLGVDVVHTVEALLSAVVI